ncbi:signal peptide protein, YSIRK family, partial [Gardnerella vaginalis JCP8522]
MTTKSGKHANKIAKNALDSAANNGVTKVVDIRKVAALSVGAAGVIAGAAIAFGATPAMAADATTSTPVDTTTPANMQDVTAKKDDEKQKSGEKQQADETNKQAADSTSAPASTPAETPATTASAPKGSDRAATPAPTPTVSSEITLSEGTKDTLPNMYAWGSSDNVYIEKGQNQAVTFKFAKPSDGSTITKVAIFPSDGNTVDNTKSRRFLEYYSDSTERQPYSGEYAFATNPDGSATLTMNKLYRNNNMAAEKYAANRCIYVYGKDKEGKDVLLYKTNIARAATLVPPKTAGSIVLKYNQELTAEQIQNKLKDALDAPTEATGKKSVNNQIIAASKSNGVGGRTGENGKFVQTPDDPENKVIINDQRAYNPTELKRFNTTTSKPGAAETTYITTVQTLKTRLITDTGYTSDDLPLTVARYDDRIDKPIVEDTDPSKVSDEVKTEIKKKLAQLNHVSQDKVTIGDDGTVTINFEGVDAKDAPKIALRDLVLKKFTEGQLTVPANDKATFVYNPLGYSNAELDRIKQAIFDANKENKELGLTSKDQISLEYLTGNLTATGDSNKGISNGQAENKITVKIKTDKAVAEFKSDIKANKLTRLPNIRTDYDVTWTNNKIADRDTDEGLSWSEDHKTIIYRYDPTKAEEFDTNKILDLLKATPKNGASGLRELTGNEKLDHEGVGGKDKKSHVGYVLKNNEPTNELTLGNMSGGYWQYKQNVSNSGENLGDAESIAGPYSWDTEADPVTVAGKKGKIYKARLFVLPYAMTHYQHVYLEQDRNPGNTAKAINVIFVPQTNHKTGDLKKSVEDHKTVAIEGKDVPTQSAYYNASDKVKKDYEDALKVAKQTLEKVGTTPDDQLTEQLKAEVDNATIKLDKARKALDGANTDKNGLDKSITEDGKPAQGQTPASGTQATDRYKNVTDPDFKTDDGKPDTTKNDKAKAAKKAYDEALQAAKELKDDANATQKDVDAAKAKLDAARAKLNDFTTSKDKLNAAIAEHGKAKYVEDAQGAQTLAPAYQNATDDERTAYDAAVKKANDLSKDPNASQKDVNAAITALEAAKKALDLKATDKSQLIAAEKLSFDNPDPDKTDGKKSTFYKNAKAKSVSTDPSVTAEQKEAAKKAYEAYDTALDNARKVIANKDATQAQVNAAKDALTNAEKALHDTYATDPDELTKVLADNFSGYLMPAYFNAFDKAKDGDADAKKAFKDYNDAYQKAKELKKALEDAKTAGTAPAQNLIDEAKTALEEARKVIDKYATNTSRLSAAVFNDLAIQNSPAYANVKELADKQNPSEEEKAQVEAAKKAKEAYEAAVAKLNQALNKQMPRDKANGKDIPDTNTPDKDGKLDDKDYLNNIQAHAQGEPLDRDVDTILKEMNAAAAELNKFATKTDELLKSVNEDDATKQTPAYKNASVPDFKNDDGTEDTNKKEAAKKAVDDYGAALNKAKELLKNPAATQKEVNDALKKLDDARKELDKYNTDTAKLVESVKKHGSTDGAAPTEGTQTSDAYRNASDLHFMKEEGGKLVPDDTKNNAAAAAKKAYDEALTKAQELLKKHDDNATPQDAKPTQKEINAALDALDTARTNLDTYKTDTSKLEEETRKSTAEGAPAVTEGDFENTPEFQNADAKKKDGADGKKVDNDDVKAYKDALAKARKLAQDNTSNTLSDHPTQKQIDDALEALKQAKQTIIDGYKTDVEKLKQAKQYAEDVFKKTPEYKNATAIKDDTNNAKHEQAGKDLGDATKQTGFEGQIAKIAEKLKDTSKLTQREVDALVKQLNIAQKKIADSYPTNADKLKNEVGDKDAQGNPVIPPFEASVPYKNALEKAKTESEADAKKNDSATARLKAYADKLAEAQKIIDQVNKPDPNAAADSKPTQAQVDQALTDLQNAKKAIDDAFKTKVDKLQNEVDDKNEDGTARTQKFEESTEFANLKGKIKGDKKPDDLVAYEQALAKAKELIKKNTGKMTDPQDPTKEVDVPKDQLPTQKEVDEAQKALKEIKDKICDNYKTNPHDLYEEFDKSRDGKDDTRNGLFDDTPEFKNADAKKDADGKDNTDMAAYKKALADAKALLDKFDRKTGKPKQGETSPTQKQLDDALDALQAAKQKITDGYKTNKSDLNTEAGKDGDFVKTPEFQNAAGSPEADAYKKALDEANKVLGDKDATQAQVDDALKKLKQAKDDLTSKHKTDKNKLYQEKGNDPEFRKSIPFLIADGKDIAEYNKALNEANAVLADPNATQAQVDEALRKLQAIKQRIIDFYNSLGSGSDNDSDGDNTGANNANANAANAVDKSMLHAEVNGALADVAN